MKRYIVIIILVIFGITVAWILRKNMKTLKTEELLSESSIEVLPVRVETVERKNMHQKLTFSGILKPVRELIVISQTQGQVENVFYELGDYVERGAVVVQVENEMLSAQLQVTEANFEKAKKDIERFEKMAEVDGVTTDQLEKMQLNLKNAEAQYVTTRKRWEDTSVKAPFSGYINQEFTKNGSMLGPGVPVFEIVDLSGFKMTLKCSEDEIVHISKGMDVTVKPKLLDDIELSGKVSRVAVSADMAQQFTIEISIHQSREKQLKGGMVVEAQISETELSDIIAIPKSTILERDGNKFVYKVVDGTAVYNEIFPGITVSDMVEIKSGLKEGDQIVTSGLNLLDNGKKIKIVE